MTFGMVCLLWYISGFLGCILGSLSEILEGKDFKLSDVFMSIVIALGGLLVLALGLVALSQIKKLNVTLIKGKK